MGFGRGGRGKILMELLNQPVRKPGQPPSQPKVRAFKLRVLVDKYLGKQGPLIMYVYLGREQRYTIDSAKPD